jgi:hypothetical protein
MASNCFLGLPPENLVGVFVRLDGWADVTALASTCRRLHSVWAANSAPIIEAIGPRYVLAFNEALVAVSEPLAELTCYRADRLHAFNRLVQSRLQRVPSLAAGSRQRILTSQT